MTTKRNACLRGNRDLRTGEEEDAFRFAEEIARVRGGEGCIKTRPPSFSLNDGVLALSPSPEELEVHERDEREAEQRADNGAGDWPGVVAATATAWLVFAALQPTVQKVVEVVEERSSAQAKGVVCVCMYVCVCRSLTHTYARTHTQANLSLSPPPPSICEPDLDVLQLLDRHAVGKALAESHVAIAVAAVIAALCASHQDLKGGATLCP